MCVMLTLQKLRRTRSPSHLAALALTAVSLSACLTPNVSLHGTATRTQDSSLRWRYTLGVRLSMVRRPTAAFSPGRAPMGERPRDRFPCAAPVLCDWQRRRTLEQLP